MKRIISFLIVALMLCSAFSGLGITASAKETTLEQVSANITDLIYESPDIYASECLINGLIDFETKTGTNISDLDYSLNRSYIYQRLAEALIEDESLVSLSAFWSNIGKTLNGELLEIANWEQIFYEIVLIDYLTYYGQTDEFQDNYNIKKAKYEFEVFKCLTDLVGENYDANVDNLIKNVSLSDAIEYSEQNGIAKELSEYTTLANDVIKGATTVKKYYDNLSTALAVQSVNEERIEFLLKIKEQGESAGDEYLVAAVDDIVEKYESTYAELTLNQSLDTMLNYAVSETWDLMVSCVPGLNIIQAGVSGLNWVFNTDKTSDNNMKLLVFYTVNSYATGAVKELKSEYNNNQTAETAEALNNGLLCYLNYQKYATSFADEFVTDILFQGAWNKIKNIFTDKSQMTYEEFKSYFDGDTTFCKDVSSRLGTYYNLYNAYLGYEQGAFDTASNIKVTEISFEKDSIEWGKEDDDWWFNHKAKVTPENASNTAVVYTSSNESVLSIDDPKNLKISTHKTGTAVITATTEDGGYSDTLTVTVVEGHGKDGFHLEDPDIATIVSSGRKCGDNVRYTMYNNGVLRITGTGSTYSYKYYDYFDAPWYNKEIDSVIISSGVTGIGKHAFKGSTIKQLTLPDTLIGIGDEAFYGCKELTEIIIGENLTKIADKAFYGCTNLKDVYISSMQSWCNINFGSSANPLQYADNLYLNNELVKDIVIPDGITVIPKYAFSCENLESIAIPNSVTSIGEGAFDNCTNLTSIVIPDSVTNIDMYAFRGCSNLTNISLSNSINEIKLATFSKCTSLSHITIPDSVTYIRGNAFSNCTSLTSIAIPNSVTDIGFSAFNGCLNLSDVYITDIAAWCNINFNNEVYSYSNPLFYADNLYLNNKPVKDVIIPEGIVNIPRDAFSCNSLESIVIPDSVTSIGTGAFQGCTKLKNIRLPEGVTIIDSYTFDGCTGLTSINIPEGIASIKLDAFNDCKNLKNVYIKDLVAWCNIEASSSPLIYADNLYLNEELITNVVLSDSVTNIPMYAFSCTNLESISIPNSVANIDECAFEGCTNLTSVIIPENVTNIDSWTFYNCTNLKTVIISNGVTSIGHCAFYNCRNISNISLPDSVTIIDDCAFNGCNSLTNIAIPNRVTSIGIAAFEDCANLECIIIPEGVTSIGWDSFRNCDNLTIYGYTGSYAETYAHDEDIPFVAIDGMVVDSGTGIFVEAESDVKISVETITDKELTTTISKLLATETFDIFNITLSKNGTEVQPDGSVTVKIPTTQENIKVYRIEDEGTLTDMKANYEDGFMVFVTDRFASYVLAESNAPSFELGDANTDGAVNVRDATAIQKHLADILTLSDEGLTVADFNGDNTINIKDATAIQKKIAGIN